MSITQPSRIIPWKRFWIPLDDVIQLTEYDEFLPEPEDNLLGKLNPTVAPLRAWSAKLALVLCGDPGMGKSTELRQYVGEHRSCKRENDHIISIDFRDIPSESVFSRKTWETREWKQWRDGTNRLSLLIDSLDEGLLKIPGFLRYLRAELASEPVHRLHLVLACRSAEWPRSEGSHLLSLWSRTSYELLELCPLRRKDFELAAEKRFKTNDIVPFRRAVFEHCLSALASRPITLFFLLDEFKPGEGLPGSHRELYERVTVRLAREIDLGRAEVARLIGRATNYPIDPHEAAIRIAAVLILCGKSALGIGEVSELSSGDVHISELVTRLQIGGKPLSESELTAAASSALFTSRGRNRVGFAHQTLAECLAAKALARMPLHQILSLTCAHEGGEVYVIPQLNQTAAWLAGERSDFLEYIINHDPAVLLCSDISKISAPHKAKLVAALLDGAKSEKIFDDTENRRFFRGLKHANLHHQLQAVIVDKTANRIARRLATDIGRDCKAEDLKTVYFSVLQDPTDDQQVREHCAYALEEILPAAEAKNLVPFALGTVMADPDDTIRGCALRTIVPHFWSVGKARRAIRRPKRENLYGSYQAVLRYHLPQNVDLKELPILLGWLVCWHDCFDDLNWLHPVADRILLLGLSHLNDPEIRSELARMWILKQRRDHELPDSDRSESNRILRTSDETRRGFVEAILASPLCCARDVEALRGFRLRLVLDTDIEWALLQAEQKDVRHHLWVILVADLVRCENLALHWDRFIRLLETSAELRERIPWFRPWNLDEKIAVDAKRQFERYRDLTLRHAPKPEPPVRDLIQSALFSCGTAPRTNWPVLCQTLHITEGPPRHRHSYENDLTKTPGWPLLSKAEQLEVLVAAKAFLKSLSTVKQLPRATHDAICQAVWLVRV